MERGASRRPTTCEGRLQPPRSPYEIKAGTVLPAVLITAINSDLPGPVVAQVREHVYDTVTGDHLLVPQGSRLIAQYDSMVAWGQERVLLCWNRLILPNGDSIDLQCMPAADLQGAAGLADEVNEHWWRILKGAAVATLLSAGTAYVAGDTTSYNPTVGQVTARSAAGEIGQVGAQITRSNLSIQPTITVRPGFSVNVIVTKDMDRAAVSRPAHGPGACAMSERRTPPRPQHDRAASSRGSSFGRALATACASALACLVGAHLLWNWTPSLPLGLYWVSPARARPTSERSWRSPSRPACERSCASGGTCRPGRCSSSRSWPRADDDVCTDGGTLTVNGAPLGAIATEDTLGRPLPHDTRCGPLPGGVVFVASHLPTSFDSRTFGPVPISELRGTVTPLWTY